ncbi:MAG TPA: LD-carboxypeptidase [Pseudomonadales bacterium]|nr:LD-carboxypeptidase [Pseudomonadales bacterium]
MSAPDREAPHAPELSRRQLIRGVGALAAGSFLSATATTAAARAPTARPGRGATLLAPRLEAGMTIGLLAPASPVAEDEDVHAAIDRIRSLGFRVKAGAALFERSAYLAGSDAARAADFNDLARDRDVDALFCIRGGYGAMRILPMIDYEALRARPKILLGYSDITALLNAVHLRTGLVTHHGPIAAANFTDYSLGEFHKVLMKPAAPVQIGAAPPFEAKPGVIDVDNRLTRITGGRAEGRLVGGNLSLVAGLLGTPFEPDFEGAILFLEDVDEAPYRIDRMLTQLWLAGRLQQCAAIAFGKFTDADYDGNTLSVEQVLRDRCEPLGIPVLKGLMIGHIDDQTVVPVGARARLDVDAGTLTLLEAAVA